MFRTRIRELRESAGYKSQRSFADAFGVAQSTVGNWEAGTREPNHETVQKLADFFHVPVGYLLGKENTLTTVHGLRHTNAAIMIMLNVVDKYAMARNGWTSDYTFKQIYGYVFPEGAQQTDDLVNTFLETKLNLRTNLRTDESSA